MSRRLPSMIPTNIARPSSRAHAPGSGSRRTLLLRTLLCTLGLAGCASAPLDGLSRAPVVRLVDIEPLDVNLFEQRYALTLGIQNPNPVSMPIDGLEYRIAINGEAFADGLSGQQTTVPAYAERLMTLGMSSSVSNLIRQLKALGRLDKPALSYSIEGEVRIAGSRGRLPFAQRGTLDFLARHRPAGGRVI